MRRIVSIATIIFVIGGCSRRDATKTDAPKATGVPVVIIVNPEKKAIKHVVEQPGFNVEPYQETPLHSRISGYVRKWHKDIGDTVKEGDILAELRVPEMEVDVKQKEAAVRYADAQIKQAKAAVLTATAQMDRARSQYDRLTKAGQSGVLDKESVDESRLGFESAKATLEKAKADEAASVAGLDVAKAHRDYAATMLKYAELRAPYDGVVTKRYVNTGDFVQPAGTGAKSQPLYVVQQIDPVRVLINVPGADAAWVKDNDVVSLRLQGSGGEIFPGKINRTSRSLNPETRTLHRNRPGQYEGQAAAGHVRAGVDRDRARADLDAADVGRRHRRRRHLLLPRDRRQGRAHAAAGGPARRRAGRHTEDADTPREGRRAGEVGRRE